MRKSFLSHSITTTVRFIGVLYRSRVVWTEWRASHGQCDTQNERGSGLLVSHCCCGSRGGEHRGYPPSSLRSITLIAKFIGPTWGPSGADRTQVGPMLAPWTVLSGNVILSLHGQNGRPFEDHFFNCIFLNGNVRIWIQNLLKFVSKVQWTIRKHWFRQWFGVKQPASHYLNQCWPS